MNNIFHAPIASTLCPSYNLSLAIYGKGTAALLRASCKGIFEILTCEYIFFTGFKTPTTVNIKEQANSNSLLPLLWFYCVNIFVYSYIVRVGSTQPPWAYCMCRHVLYTCILLRTNLSQILYKSQTSAISNLFINFFTQIGEPCFLWLVCCLLGYFDQFMTLLKLSFPYKLKRNKYNNKLIELIKHYGING